MIVCSGCGTVMEGDLRFCTECGMQNPAEPKREILPTPKNDAGQGIRTPSTIDFPNAPAIGSQSTPSGTSVPSTLSFNTPSMPVASSAGYPNAQSNQTVRIAIFAIAATLVLLLIGGIGSRLLLSGSNHGEALNNSQRSTPKDGTEPATQQNVTRNPERPSSLTNGYDSVEHKVVDGELLTVNDLTDLSAADLKVLRNTIFARHGRLFDTPELQRYFSSKSWYAPRSDYSDGDLSSNDKDNRNLILAAEKGAR